MDNLQKYKPTDKMIDLISDNYSLLQLMSRLMEEIAGLFWL